MKKQTAIWKTKDGQKVRICDMTDSHLRNAIKMMLRYAEHYLHEELCATGSAMCSLSGEMAQYYAEQEFERFVEMTPEDLLSDNPQFLRLELEAERRGLKL